jgi:hypothetical protein
MTRRKQKRSSKNTRSESRTKQIRTPITNSEMASIRKPSRPPPAEPYHVAVDRQLKSGHQTYEAAEKAALKIKNRYPQLHVSVFDAKDGRHKVIQLSKLASASNNNRGTARAAVNRRNAAAG